MSAQHDPAALRAKVEQALRRCGSAELTRVSVHVEGEEVVLRGRVESAAARDEAERVARSVGVRSLSNELRVAEPDRSAADDPVHEASLESFPASDPPAWVTR